MGVLHMYGRSVAGAPPNRPPRGFGASVLGSGASLLDSGISTFCPGPTAGCCCGSCGFPASASSGLLPPVQP